MKLYYTEEPLLEFGTGTHVCPKAGITQFGVYDVRLQARRDKILVGAVGSSATLQKLYRWLEQCAEPISEKVGSRHPALFLGFCGFRSDVGYHARFVLEDEITRTLNNTEMRRILKLGNRNERVEAAVNLYYPDIEFLARYRVVDVIVCIVPDVLYDVIAVERKPAGEEQIEEAPDDLIEMNFRRALKARTMHLGKPLQIVRELSLEPGALQQQDDATKAWNFCTAMYYKANKTVPWKLLKNVNRPSVCFAGIGFYRSRDRKILHTSLAQVFDELGQNVILRGTPVEESKDDRRPHLSAEQAYELLKRALVEYKIALGTQPGRLVVHKSSNYNDGELEGFREATDEVDISAVDFITLLDADMRLLRDGAYPPYRGTHIELDQDTHLLYTRGSVPYYKTYPGKYLPQPLEVRLVQTDEAPEVICQEILSLTKMNWNSTQFDRKYPITIECARKVGQIMKYVDPNRDPQTSYSFYM